MVKANFLKLKKVLAVVSMTTVALSIGACGSSTDKQETGDSSENLSENSTEDVISVTNDTEGEITDSDSSTYAGYYKDDNYNILIIDVDGSIQFMFDGYAVEGTASSVNNGIMPITITDPGDEEVGLEFNTESGELIVTDAAGYYLEAGDTYTLTKVDVDLIPLDPSVDINNMTDCTVMVDFTRDDFNWTTGKLTIEVVDPLCYDTVDVNSLSVGDIVYIGTTFVTVDTITESDDGTKIINENTETQVCLQPQDGGTYQIVLENDYIMKKILGKTEIALSDNVVLHDCTDVDSSVDISSDELESYIEGLSDDKVYFYDNSSSVIIENGQITEITRVWTP